MNSYDDLASEMYSSGSMRYADFELFNMLMSDKERTMTLSARASFSDDTGTFIRIMAHEYCEDVTWDCIVLEMRGYGKA